MDAFRRKADFKLTKMYFCISSGVFWKDVKEVVPSNP